ncbi:MAG: hypothetical protein P1P84_23760 [Deferrisomatales bacterium]|nr:hypothetical protein [Deferrisomatales bacterium]
MSCSVCQGCGVRVCGTVVDGLCDNCRDLGIVPRGLESRAERLSPEAWGFDLTDSRELAG